MGWILRFILFMVVIWVIWRFLAGILEGLLPEASRTKTASGGGRVRGGGGPVSSVPLVRDPVCGTYVVRARALSSGSGEATHYFCSEKCRDEFRRQS